MARRATVDGRTKMESTGSKLTPLATSDLSSLAKSHRIMGDAKIVDTSIYARGSVLEPPSTGTGATEQQIASFGIIYLQSSRRT